MSTDVEELLAELKTYPDGADLLITAFYTAAFHYRRSTICTPFPSEVLPPAPNTKEKDFAALHAALAALPPVHTLLGGGDALRGLSPQCRGLLQWLLLNATRRRRFSLVAMGEMVRQLQQRSGAGAGTSATGGGGGGRGGWQLPAFAGHNSPTYILRAHDGHAQEPFLRGTIAYHGTQLENLHSIVQTGLQNLSGTRLQRTGAIFGNGIYLSTNYDTAFSFCQPCDSWPRSRYGTKLRALLVCEVDLDRCSAESGADAAAAASAPAGGPAAAPGSSSSSRGAPGLPDTYLLVQRADAVRLLFVLIFCDAAALPHGASRPARINWCTLLVLLYAGFLVGKALLSALRQHRY